MSEWKTIDSAPNDGSVVLGYFPCGAITVIYYDNYGERYGTEDGMWSFEKSAHACCSSVVVYPDIDCPTHWQHLPQPPEDKNE